LDHNSSATIGSQSAGAEQFNGKIDEVRVSSTALTADWILTEYNILSNASGSISVGTETTNPYPFIEGWVLAQDFSFVDVTFSEGVYSTSGGSGALDSSDFDITFTQNGGTATDATITGVTKTDGNPLSGGETVIRVNLNVNGAPSGVETIEIKPADGSSIYNGTGGAASAATTTGLITLTASSWYDGAWGYRIKITIDSSNVTSDLNNFPYLISIPSNAGLAANARADGYDLVFTEDDEVTKLDHEVEKYVTGTGELVAWVRIPFLSSTVDTDIYLYYGNPSATDQSNAAGVWDANYAGVWHLSETTGNHADSTSNPVDAVPEGDVDQNVTGKIAGADGFYDGSPTDDDNLKINDPGPGSKFDIISQLTLEAWIWTNNDGGETDNRIIQKQIDINNPTYGLFRQPDETISFRTHDGSNFTQFDSTSLIEPRCQYIR